MNVSRFLVGLIFYGISIGLLSFIYFILNGKGIHPEALDSFGEKFLWILVTLSASGMYASIGVRVQFVNLSKDAFTTMVVVFGLIFATTFAYLIFPF